MTKDKNNNESQNQVAQPEPLEEKELKPAQNPNPRANNNIAHGPLDASPGSDVGTEITDGEAG